LTQPVLVAGQICSRWLVGSVELYGNRCLDPALGRVRPAGFGRPALWFDKDGGDTPAATARRSINNTASELVAGQKKAQEATPYFNPKFRTPLQQAIIHPLLMPIIWAHSGQ
jgi:hypothetical protein